MSWLNRLWLRCESTEWLRNERLHVLEMKGLAHRLGSKLDIERLNDELGDIDIVLNGRGKL